MSTPLPDIASAEDFPAAAGLVLRYLRDNVPLASWSVTRVDGDEQTFLFLDEDGGYDLRPGFVATWEAGFCVRMVQDGAPNVAPDAGTVPGYVGAPILDAFPIRTYAGAPVYEPDGRLFGTICGLDPDDHKGDEVLARSGPVLQLLGQLLSMSLAADRLRARAERALQAATLVAETDPLTGLHNRRAWERLLQEEASVFARFHDPTAVVVLDLDLLKEVNDNRGHHAGDEYIRGAATALRLAAREADSVARLGGDEFGVLLRRCSQEEAGAVVERIYERLEAEGVAGSVGWAPISVIEGVESAMKEADSAMYRAKHRRREAAEAARAARARTSGTAAG